MVKDEAKKLLVQNVNDMVKLSKLLKVYFELFNKLLFVMNVVDLENHLKIYVVIVMEKKEMLKRKKLKLKSLLELIME